MCLPPPGIVVISGFLILMAIYAPVCVAMTALAVVLIVIEFISMLLYPSRIRVFDPPVFMVKRHAVLFDVFVADITCDLLFPSLLVARNAGAKHIGNKVCGDCITLLNTLVALNARDLIFKMYLVGKFQVPVLFWDIMFDLYFHAGFCVTKQAGFGVAGVKIFHVTGKAFRHLRPFWFEVVFIIVTGIAILQAPLNVLCVAVMDF